MTKNNSSIRELREQIAKLADEDRTLVLEQMAFTQAAANMIANSGDIYGPGWADECRKLAQYLDQAHSTLSSIAMREDRVQISG